MINAGVAQWTEHLPTKQEDVGSTPTDGAMKRKHKKVLITGDRDWANVERVREVFTGLLKRFGRNVLIIHGDCRGADTIAKDLAREMFALEPRAYPAAWLVYGKPAGHIRNQEMIDRENLVDDPIDLCIAIHNDIENSRGTKDCAGRAKKHAIKVLFVTSDSFQSWRPKKET